MREKWCFVGSISSAVENKGFKGHHPPAALNISSASRSCNASAIAKTLGIRESWWCGNGVESFSSFFGNHIMKQTADRFASENMSFVECSNHDWNLILISMCLMFVLSQFVCS